MTTKRWRALAALTAVAALGLSACSGGGSSDGDGDGSTGGAEFNAALDSVYNPSEEKGGTIRLANSSDWDTLDPGETYYGFSWNFARLYGRSLVMFKAAPGDASNELVPDLAEDGPYRTPDMNTDSAIETPDDYTIIFHLKAPFAGMDYLAQLTQTMPVPEAKDTGAKYRDHVISSGPYMFDTLEAGKSFTLKRNPEWDQATDENRTALPDGYDVQLNVNADDIDNRILSGDLDLDVAGTGAQPAALARVLGDPALKANVDNPTIARLWYTSINPTVKPLDDINCRKAIMYGMDHTSYQNAYGGPFAGGEIATTVLPPQIPGYKDFDLYPAGDDNKGDLEAAKAALEDCGQPDGFETAMSYRSDRPKEKATAEAFQQALDRIGIKLTLKGFPAADYFSTYAGNPGYVVKNDIGLATNGWGADWNDGFGFLSQITDSRVIRETGGSSNTSVRIPEVDELLDLAVGELDTATRDEMWGQIDTRVMEEAVIYPGVYSKSVLLRGENLTNVFVNNSYGMYDYMSMGVQQ